MKKNLIFTMVDMNLSGANLSLFNLFKYIDYDKYNVELFVLKEHDDEVINNLPKEVKVSFLYKDNPLFDLENEPLRKGLYFPYIINKIFAKINTKNIKKLKLSLRKSYVPNKEYDVAVSFDEQSFRYMKKINAKKKIVRYAFGKVFTKEDPNNKPYNFCDYVVAQCEGLKKDLAEHNKVDEEKIKVIHNIFDNDKIIKKSNEINIERNTKYVFSTCARIVPIKRIHMIPLVCKILTENGIDDFKWYIIGGPEKEKYMIPVMENIKNTNTEKYIDFVGQVENPYPYVKNSDIYIQCSNIDAWPRSVMESLILGTPVLCTKTSGGTEQITPGFNGELCEIDNEKDLAEKLIYMIKNLDKYKFECRVDNEEIVNQYYKLFNS